MTLGEVYYWLDAFSDYMVRIFGSGDEEMASGDRGSFTASRGNRGPRQETDPNTPGAWEAFNKEGFAFPVLTQGEAEDENDREMIAMLKGLD